MKDYNDLLWEDQTNLAKDQILKDKIVSMDFFNMFCGDMLGYGCSRWVFKYQLEDNLVIKIDMSDHNANVIEYDVWQSVRDTEFAKWFAPCIRLSQCGRVLIQNRGYKKDHKYYPEKIPAFFTDIKIDNFRFVGKQLVCIDYALNNLHTQGMTKRMKKVNWK